jgi:hypothetical protein
MDKQNTVYTFHVNDLHDKIKTIEESIRQKFSIEFIAYDQTEIKIAFTKELSDEEEMILLNIIYS